MLRTPSLKAIHYFEVAARHMNFTAAAQELHVTQGAVSRMVQSLEEDLQVQLFLRHGRQLQLTSKGEQYFSEIRGALQWIAAANENINRSTDRHVIHVGASPAFAARWLVPRLVDFQDRHSEIHVNLVDNTMDAASASSGRMLWIRYERIPQTGMEAIELPIQTKLALVCSPEFLTQWGPFGKPQDILDKPLLSYTAKAHDIWQDFFLHYDLPMERLQRSHQFQHLMTLARAAMTGLGIALIPSFLMEPEISAGKLVRLLPEDFGAPRKHYVVYRKEHVRDASMQAFVQWLVHKASFIE